MCPETSPPIQRKELADGSLVCWPKQYSHLSDETGPAKKRVVAALRDCMRAAPYSEFTADLFDLTGRYAGPKSVCCLNHAGHAMVIWWSYAGGDMTVWRYVAEYEIETGLIVVRELEGGKAVADLVIVKRGPKPEIRFDWYPGVKGPKDTLRRFAKRATLSDRATDAIRAVLPKNPHRAVEGFIADEHAPWEPDEFEEFTKFLEGDEIAEVLQTLCREEVTHTAESWAKVRVAIKPLTRTLYRAFRGDLSASQRDPDGPVPPLPSSLRKLQNRVRYYAQEVLQRHSLTLEVGPDRTSETKTLYEWFQLARYYNEKGTGGFPNVRFRDAVTHWLGIGATGDYGYELSIDMVGVAAEATLPFGKRIGDAIKRYKSKLPGDSAKRIAKWVEEKLKTNAGARLMVGTMTVKSVGQTDNWESTYWVTFFVAGGGMGGGGIDKKYLKATGKASTDNEWKPEHFTGHLTVLSGHMARDTNGALVPNQLIWLAEGSHPAEPSTQLLYNELDTDLSAQALGIGWGYVLDPDDIESLPPTPVVPKLYSYSAEYADATDVHFVLGSATVREEGRRLLRLLAAHELVALRDTSTRVTFDGFADRLGPEGYNDVLSQMRGDNAKTAMLDALGGSAAARMTVHGHGERPLRLLDAVFGFPDSSPSPEWRRVFVIIHGVASIELVVRDLKDVHG